MQFYRMSNTIKLSGLIITFNEEKNIERCLKSLEDVCDEIVVVDSGSTDRTQEICETFNVRFIHNDWPGFKEQKNFAQERAQNDIVLQLDADEALSEELKKSILHLKNNWELDGYSFNRYTNFCGKWIKHSGWYPDSKLRIYNKAKGKWTGLDPHPFVELSSVKAGHIKGDLLHYSYHKTEELVTRSARYAKEAAFAMKANGKKSSTFKLIISPLFRFSQDYLLKGGFRDGFEGYIICKTAAYYTFLKYMYLRLLDTGKDI